VHMRRRGAQRLVAELGVIGVGPAGLGVVPALSADDSGALGVDAGWPSLGSRLGMSRAEIVAVEAVSQRRAQEVPL